MKQKGNYRIKLVLVGIVTTIALCSGRAKADFTFGEPVNLGPEINSASGDGPDCVSYDGLEMYFDSTRSGGHGEWDIWVSTRATIDDEWGTPINLLKINKPNNDYGGSISFDGLELYFCSWTGGSSGEEIWISRRQSKQADWGTPVKLGSIVNSIYHEEFPMISKDGLELYFNSDRNGGFGNFDIWVSRRARKNDPWGEPTNLGSVVNGSTSETSPFLLSEGLTLLFSEGDSPFRQGGYGNSDIWMTRRASISELWGAPVNLGPMINTRYYEGQPRISTDCRSLYFCSNRPGGLGDYDVWQASIIPIVDFNGDHKVDEADMHIMVDHWGENYSLCDIGPTPLGDGIVDIQDFIVLTEHLYQIAAHWKLDETDGSIAYDSVGDYDGAINGNPSWQPTGGMKGGSLFLDGIDDYIDTPFILDPSKGPFSVFAWVYSWMPGQVIISQQGQSGGTWLGIDPSGKLMTGLSDVNFGALESESFITDIQWHHVGFVYDMDTLHRRLYVDGILVAEDTSYVAGSPSNDGLYIGSSKDLETGTFFSGFVDDVRIYKQALTADEITTMAQ
jgi:hypothetical protein